MVFSFTKLWGYLDQVRKQMEALYYSNNQDADDDMTSLYLLRGE